MNLQIVAITETVQLAIVNNFVPIVTVLISLGGAVVSWLGYIRTGKNAKVIESVKEVVVNTGSEAKDAAVEAKDAAVEAKNSLQDNTKKTEEIGNKIDGTLTTNVQNAVEAALSQSQIKYEKEISDLKKQLAEARITGERRKVF